MDKIARQREREFRPSRSPLHIATPHITSDTRGWERQHHAAVSRASASKTCRTGGRHTRPPPAWRGRPLRLPIPGARSPGVPGRRRDGRCCILKPLLVAVGWGVGCRCADQAVLPWAWPPGGGLVAAAEGTERLRADGVVRGGWLLAADGHGQPMQDLAGKDGGGSEL